MFIISTVLSIHKALSWFDWELGAHGTGVVLKFICNSLGFLLLTHRYAFIVIVKGNISS